MRPIVGCAHMAGEGRVLRRYDKDGTLLGGVAQRLAGDPALQPRKEEALHCVRCHHRITLVHTQTTVAGKHQHCFTNPLGVTYYIGCFREAPGCLPEGEPSFEFTWFPGYAWEIQRCGSCHLHMGWRFQSEDSAFYGLVRTQLVAMESGE